MRGISKSFAGVAALKDVSLEVRPGEVHALLGENGAGKSTLMNVATGVIQPDAGSMVVPRADDRRPHPGDAAELGIAIVHQHPAVLPDLTVEENLRLALPASFFADGTVDARPPRAPLLASVGLHVHLTTASRRLSVAQKHLLEIAKALAVQPKLLVLDEPTAPLGQDSVDLLFALVRDAVAEGTSVVYITHRLAEVRELADRVTVLRDGPVRGTAVVDEISDGELLAMIVGRQLDSTFPPKLEAADDDAVNFVMSRPLRRRLQRRLARRRAAARSSASPASSATGRATCSAPSPASSPSTATVTVGGRELNGNALLHHAAYMPADRQQRGPDDAPVGARERGDLRAAEVPQPVLLRPASAS